MRAAPGCRTLGGFHGLIDQRMGIVGQGIAVPGQARAEHSKASTGAGGALGQQAACVAPGTPRLRHTWKTSACTPGRSSRATRSIAAVPRGAFAHSSNYLGNPP